ncbi:hypothetical protein DACRYDRAFT_20750, partial [Dacryopinax primogenitus]
MPVPALSRSDSFASTTSARVATRGLPTPAHHADWPWEPTSPSSPRPRASVTPSKPVLSRAHTSPAPKRKPTQAQPITPPPSPPFNADHSSL